MEPRKDMAYPMQPGETPRRVLPETLTRHIEQAYDVSQRREARRKLNRVRAAAAAAVLTVAGAVGVGNAITGNSDYKQAVQAETQVNQEQQLIQELYKPNLFNDGEYKIVITNQLNIRKAPMREDNTFEWKNIIEVNGKNIQGADSFNVNEPFIGAGQSLDGSTENGEWIVLDIKVQEGSSIVNEKAFIAKAPETGEFVQVVRSGTTKPLSGATGNDLLGVVSVNRNP